MPFVNEFKAYPEAEEFLTCSKDGKGSSWQNVNSIRNDMGVVAIVDSKGNKCLKSQSCKLTQGGICKVPDIYKGAEPLKPSVKSINKLYLIVFQDNCGNAKCQKEGRYRLGCLEIPADKTKKVGKVWKITALVKIGFFSKSVSMDLEVTSSGVKVVKDGSGRLKLGATYPAKAVFVKQNEASGGAMQKLKKYYPTKKCARGKTVKAYLYDWGAADQSYARQAKTAKRTLPTRIDRSSSRLKF